MTMERSSTIMDEIFASPEEEGRGRLLKIMQDFLVSEAAKHSAKEKGAFLPKSINDVLLKPQQRRTRGRQSRPISIWTS